MGKNICYPFFRSDISDSWGGSFESTYLLADELLDTCNTTVVLSGIGKPYQRAQNYEFPIKILPFKTLSEMSIQEWNSLLRKPALGIHVVPYMARIINYIRSRKPNIIHANDPITSILWGTCAQIAGIPFVSHIRGEYINNNKVRVISHLSDHLVFVSESGYQYHQSHLANQVSTSVVHNGVDTDRFHPDNGGDLRQELGIVEETPLFGFIGDLVPRKRPLLFVEAAVKYLQENHGQFVLAGKTSNEIKNKIHTRLSKEGLEEHVTLLGFRDDIENIAASIDVLILTSTESGEAFPRTPLEAMASGTPVVTTSTAGVSEAVIDGETGCVLQSDPNPQEIAAVMESIATDEKSREIYSKKSRENILENFSSRCVTKRIEDIYRCL